MKRILWGLAVVTVAMLGSVSCSPSPESTGDGADASMWIAAWTPERIDADAVIRIEATDSLLAGLDTTRSLKEVFRFSPSVEGEAVYTDGGHYIDFLPRKGALTQGKQYNCKVNLAALTGIKGLSDFTFSFFVERWEAKFKDVRLRVDPADIEKVIVEGLIEFSFNPSDDILKNSSVRNNYTGADTQLLPTGNEKQYSFRITDILREGKDYDLRVDYRTPWSKTAAIGTKVDVPAINRLKLLNLEVNDGVQPYLELEFSEPLDESQELDGLITIGEIDDVRIERNGANVRVFYPDNSLTTMVLRISASLRTASGIYMQEDVEKYITQEAIPPEIRVPVSGTILPDGSNLKFPFSAVNLAAVDVEVVKIYSDNVLSFLQSNSINETRELRRYGRLIYRQTVRLDQDKSLNLHEWQNFSVDLKNLFRQEQGAIYNIRLTFRKAYSLYDRTEPARFGIQSGLTDGDKATWDTPREYISRKAPDYDWWEYNWRDKDDPSKDTYYMRSDLMPEYNLVASNLGLIVKQAPASVEKVWCSVSDIVTTAPLSGIRVVAYNYQLREIGSAYTNEQGFADFRTDGKAFVFTATDGVSTTFLKVDGASELSTSNFKVSGKKVSGGIKGFVYGERGVWRPGDDIFLTLIVEDKQRALPANHPVTMDLYTPSGQLYRRQTLTKSVDGMYVFQTKTSDDAPTGNWDARFKVGGQTFHHTVRIETIKPNRLKVNILSPDVLQEGTEVKLGIESRWLTGPAANGLKAKLAVSMFDDPTPFEKYKDYKFYNPLYAANSEEFEIFTTELDSLGKYSGAFTFDTEGVIPGMSRANLIARVSEPGGDESITSTSVRYSPYSSYVGINLGKRVYETDTDLQFPVVVLDPDGNLFDSRSLEYKVYRLKWNWWYDGYSASYLRNYVQGKSAEIVAQGTLETKAGKAELPFRVNYPSYGSYLVFVRNPKSGHATGGTIYVDWPSWRGNSGKEDALAATMLSFKLDKQKYEVGETATVYLPQSAGGRVLISIENGSMVLSRRWVKTSADSETAYKFTVTKDLAPNFYVQATLLQPYAQTVNDLPIRMYGVQGAEVFNPQSILHPEIVVADEILPQQKFSVKVREKDNKPMTYTLAIVDEGLLDITSFKTPDPWSAMNQREALGIKTWDMYRYVFGAYAGKYTSILSIGGDEALRKSVGAEKRYNPVVKFLGPFTISGGTKTHEITLPMYVGSVRVMVVAAHSSSYGRADKTVTVRSPLMVLSTLPRTLACADNVAVPVNVFNTEENIKNVTVKIQADGPVSIVGSPERTLDFSGPGEQLTEFGLQCDRQNSGTARIIISAQGGGKSASDTVHIDVRNPQPLLTTLERKIVGGGKTETFEWPTSTGGEVRMEVASVHTINFSKAFDYFSDYRHLCTEQLSSQAMFMLYGRRFLDEAERSKAEKDLPKILMTILSRQLPGGGFAYWSGNKNPHEWVTSMAGEVMTEARRQGFFIDDSAYTSWIAYQNHMSRMYLHTTEYALDNDQAYRLYTLALAGKSNAGAMNRLREAKTLSQQAMMRLAAAYAVSGREDVAGQLIEKAESTPKIRGDYRTFYSALRDMAMAMEAYVLAGNEAKAVSLAQKVADRFSSGWCSTQETAFASVAMSRLADLVSEGNSEILLKGGGYNSVLIRDLPAVKTFPLDVTAGSISIENRNSKDILASLSLTRRPAADEVIPAAASGVEIKICYTDMQGKLLSIDKLQQGKEFIVYIEVKKNSDASKSMALTYSIPSGWEIWNDRLINGDRDDNVEYSDIRDESINWYFSMDSGEIRRFSVRLRATWCGKYVLPATTCEDMYDEECRANTSVSIVEVEK